VAALVLAVGCGGGGSSSPTATSSPTVNNVQPIQVTLGPNGDYLNGLFTSVTICVPGTSNCQTIDGVLVDSGSEGLRLLSSEVTLPLVPTTDASGNVLANCASFADNSYQWGPISKASVRMAGEQAASVNIQLVGGPGVPDAPDACSSGGTAADTISALGARGILGIGVFREDCGSGCTGLQRTPPPIYFACASGTCSVTTVALAGQVQNPVWLFAQDNNGYAVTLPSVPPLGARTVAGSLVFGIGTQPNNALGSARPYTTDNFGEITTVFNGMTLSSYFDTGTNTLSFLDSSTITLPACPGDDSDFSCPPTTVSLTATNTGRNGTSGPITFSAANAETLFDTNNFAFNDVVGSDTGDFDWGLPFFYGRTVFTGIEGQTSPAGVGPYWAY
jgi:Protein of unknown function (DUF3443)